MSTPAISNVLNSIMSTPQGQGGKMDNQAAGGAFNQVLSREINNQNRNNSTTNETAQGTKKDGTNADKTSKNDAQSADGGKTTEAKAPEDDKTTQAVDGKKTADKDDESKTDPATTASADILAFVNALTQSAAGGKATPADAAKDIKDRIAGLDVKGSKADATALGALPAATGDKAVPLGKQPDFAAALDKATTGAAADKGGKTAAAENTQTVKNADADMAAAAQVVKTLEPVGPTPQNLAAMAVATTAALQQHVSEVQDPQSNRLLPQVGTDDWGQALGQKISWMVQGAQQTATLTLNPPDLGPMQVVVHVNNNQASANFTAHQPEVRQALEAAMPRLREMLNESGIQLGQSNVSAGLPNQQNNASGEQRQGNRSSNQASNAVETAAINVSHIPVSSTGTGMVDTFA